MAGYVAPFCCGCGDDVGTRRLVSGARARVMPVARKAHTRSVVRCCFARSDAPVSRRNVLAGAAAGFVAVCLGAAGGVRVLGELSKAEAAEAAANIAGASPPAPSAGQPGIVVLPNGLRFSDFVSGNGPQPQWGNLLLIEYQTYVVMNGKDLKLVDTTEGRSPYFFRHGNGFQVQGMEEAVHTMRVGGFRRVIIPPHMSYTSSDLGPLPETARNRKRMNEALNDSQGLLVMDLRLLDVQPTKDPQGYYSDITDRAAIQKLLSE